MQVIITKAHGYGITIALSLYNIGTVLSAKNDSDFMFCLQKYQGLIIDRSLVY